MVFIQETPTVLCFSWEYFSKVPDIQTHLVSEHFSVGGAARNPHARFLSHCCATSHHYLVPFSLSNLKKKQHYGQKAIELRRTAKILRQHSSRLRTEDPLKIMPRSQSRRPLLNRNRAVHKALGEEPLRKGLLPLTFPLQTTSGSLSKSRDQSSRDEKPRV